MHINTYLFFMERKAKGMLFTERKYLQQCNRVVSRDFVGEEKEHSQGRSNKAFLHSSSQHAELLWGRMNSLLKEEQPQ